MTNEVPFLHSFIAGNVAGISGLAASYPFDTVKIRLQTQPGQYSGLVNCLRRMAAEEGLLSLFRGLPSPALGYGAINAVAFSTKDSVVQFLGGEETVTNNIYGGIAAGATSAMVRGPVERIKTIMQHAKRPDGTSPYKNTFQCTLITWRTSGIRSVMAGTASTAVREMMQYGAYYPSYAVCKRLLTFEGEEQPSKFRIAACGAIAGMLQWLPPSYCVDVVKSRIQAEPVGTYSGMVDCARQAYRKEGLFVFFRGLNPAMVRAIPMHSTIFLMYEITLESLQRRNSRVQTIPA